ncbi:MAG: PQ-loop repeat-containing protein [Aeromicrobium sp.]
MHLSLSSWVGLLGTVLAFLSVVPQAHKLHRAASAAGVSIAALANSVVSGLGWTYFGFVRHDVWVALPAAVTVPPAIYAGVRAFRREGDRERLWLPVLWTGVVALAAVSARWLGDAPLTVILGFSIVFMVGPAAWTVWTSTDLTAISRSAWYWLIAEAVLTGTYGVMAQVGANLLYASVAITGAVFIVARVAAADRTRTLLDVRAESEPVAALPCGV